MDYKISNIILTIIDVWNNIIINEIYITKSTSIYFNNSWNILCVALNETEDFYHYTYIQIDFFVKHLI